MQGRAYVEASRDDTRPPSSLAAVMAASAFVRSQWEIWRDRQRFRRALARMSERKLADIGVSWSDIAADVSKPFWRE